MGYTTNFVKNGIDIGQNLVEKAYLIDRYPELADTFKQAGLWTCGENNLYGHLGDNTIVNKSSPVQTIAGGTNWKQVAASWYHTVAIKTDGTLWSWGYNANGELGSNNITYRSSPIQTIAGGTNWKQVAVSRHHTHVIKTDGTLWLWGRNTYGALGDNTIVNKSSPIQTIAAGTNWKQVCGGAWHLSAIKTDGTLWLWGRNNYGQLGDNTIASKSSPIQTVAGGTNWKQVDGGYYHTAAIKTDGTLWLWGRNTYGALGDNTGTRRSSPVQTIAGGTNWKQVVCGTYHTAAIKTDGTLWSWGRNSYGALGNNTTTGTVSPVQTISAGTNWKLVAAGGYNTAAIKTNGTLWLWGYNNYGQLGDNTIVSKSSPIQSIASGINWTSVTCGWHHTAAIRDDSADSI